MERSIVIIGPAGCGKTRNAERIKQHFGLDAIVDEGELWHGQSLIPEGVLYLTQNPPPAAAMNGALMMTYADAALMVGLP